MVATSRRPLVEILYFDGCPNHAAARELVTRISRELDLDPDVRLVRVDDPEQARRQRFLGSPTIRVDGRDVEPGADARSDYAVSCRVYPSERGVSGCPDESWLRDALAAAA